MFWQLLRTSFRNIILLHSHTSFEDWYFLKTRFNDIFQCQVCNTLNFFPYLEVLFYEAMYRLGLAWVHMKISCIIDLWLTYMYIYMNWIQNVINVKIITCSWKALACSTARGKPSMRYPEWCPDVWMAFFMSCMVSGKGTNFPSFIRFSHCFPIVLPCFTSFRRISPKEMCLNPNSSLRRVHCVPFPVPGPPITPPHPNTWKYRFK